MSTWTRVTRKDPCPVCGKPDWCCVGTLFACCMRVVSDKPAKNGGYLHPLGTKGPAPPSQRHELPSINASKLMAEWACCSTLEYLSNHLSLEMWTLQAFGVAWSSKHKAWAFPMSDGYGNYIGIRLRDDSGHKWAVKGSRQGIFLPRAAARETVWITEGPTDAAAGLQIGLYTIGRPSCRGSVEDIKTAIRRSDCRRAVIVTDNDSPGYTGALDLADRLHVPSVIIAPPAKDLRAYVTAGGDSATLEVLLTGQLWKQPRNHG